MEARLDQLSASRLRRADMAGILDPDIYRFIYDLQRLYPKAKAIDCTDPEKIRHLIQGLRTGDFFEKERRKETEKEQKEALHAQDNTL